MSSAAEKYTNLTEEVKKYVRSYFMDHSNKKYVYHNLEHTENIVRSVMQIATHYKLNEYDLFVVNTAAWFHDTGYFSAADQHERISSEIAETFLTGKEIEKETIAAVKSAILATRLPQKPENLTEQIICDADLFHFGTDDFGKLNKQVRRETEALTGYKINKEIWRVQSIELLENHHFFTDYCHEMLDAKKKENIHKLKTRQAGENEEEKDHYKKKSEKKEGEENKTSDDHEGDIHKLNAKNAPASRGIQTMFRIVSSNNQRLSVMADNKAHIMITVNSIILSIILGVLLRKLDPDNALVFPSILFIIISLFAIIFAILATRPSIPAGKFTALDIAEKKINLLFFGNFYKMTQDEYSDGMYKIMEDRKFLYGTLIKDVYAQGVVLGKKYHLLRISYNIFMYGLSASVLAFILALMFFTPHPTNILLPGLAKNPPGYNLMQPEKISVPGILNEVSGITFYNGNADTIYAQQDEASKLFHFHLGDTKEFASKYGKRGDYEDLAITKDYIILLRSDGVFVTMPFAEANHEEAANVKEFKDLLPGGEYESIAAEKSGRLFVLCKQSKKNNDAISKGYIFNLQDDGSLIAGGEFSVSVNDIESKSGDEKINFRPSGLALNQCTKEWYIISSINKLLVVTDSIWHVKEVYPLKPSVFRQPEGIAFDDDCNLYISNEKSSGSKASILKFIYD